MPYPDRPWPSHDAELFRRYARQHVLYCAEQATLAATEAFKASDRSAARNAAIESFAINRRCLVAFLTGENAHPRDVLAEDYVPGWCSSGALPANRTNHDVAHLSVNREDDAVGRTWSFWDDLAPVLTQLEEWAGRAGHRVDDETRSELAKLSVRVAAAKLRAPAGLSAVLPAIGLATSRVANWTDQAPHPPPGASTNPAASPMND